MEIFGLHTSVSPLLLLILGFCVGTISSFYGIGGGWLATPILNIIGLPMPYAIGTSLVYIISNTILGTIKHGKFQNVNYLLGILVGVSSIFGVILGKSLITYLEGLGTVDTIVRYIYIFFLLFVGIYMAFEKKIKFKTIRNKKKSKILPPVITINTSRNKSIKVSFWVILIIGFLMGLMSSIMGIGGVVLLPVFIYIIKIPVKLAVGTTLFTIMVISMFSGTAYIIAKRVDWLSVIFMFIATIIGTSLGANATRKVDSEELKVLYAITILFGSISVIFKQLNLNLISNILIFSTAGLSTFVIIYMAYIRNSSVV